MTLCIAAPSFAQPSETFIRAHVQTVSQGATVLVCNDGVGSQEFSCPVLSNIDPYPTPRNTTERLINAFRFQTRDKFDRSLFGISELRLREFLLQHGVTHCLAEFGPTGCLERRACLNANVNLFVHFHGYDATSLPKRSAWRRHYSKLFRDASGIIASSRFIRDQLANFGYPEEKLHVSACGIAPHDFPESKREPGQLLAIGRFVEKKSPLTTIIAFSQIAGMVPHAQLQMVGDGVLFDSARELVKKLGLSDRVILHGSQPHDFVRRLLGQASIFVQHSVTALNGDIEGLPVVILEAMATGLPVISTHHSGIPDVVEHEKTGLLVAENDTAGMAQAMLELLRNPERAAQMGKAGAPRIKTSFSHQAIATRLHNIMGIAT